MFVFVLPEIDLAFTLGRKIRGSPPMRDKTRHSSKFAIGTDACSDSSGAGGTTIGNGRAIAVLLTVHIVKVFFLDLIRAALKGTARLIATERRPLLASAIETAKADELMVTVANKASLRSFNASREIELWHKPR